MLRCLKSEASNKQLYLIFFGWLVELRGRAQNRWHEPRNGERHAESWHTHACQHSGLLEQVHLHLEDVLSDWKSGHGKVGALQLKERS